MTNYEKIKQMSVEELAILLCSMADRYTCDETCPGGEYCKYGEGRANGLVKWLKMEVKDERN